MSKVLNFLKNAGVTFYLNVVAAMLVLAAMIALLISNGVSGYALNNSAGAITAAVFALLAAIAVAVTGLKFGNQHIITFVLRVVVIALAMYAVCELTNSRTTVAGALWTWDKNNPIAQNALNTAIVSGVFYVLAILPALVCAFFNGNNKIAKGEVADSAVTE